MIELSIITPFYKAEKYIVRCVQSLMEQTLKDGIEFIFIDDCSPDNSLELLKSVINSYPKRKGQIHIIHHTKNLGVTQSRRDGLQNAKGKYIGWCDADDWLEANMFEKMLNAAIINNTDVVVCNYIEHWAKEKDRTVKYKAYTCPYEAIKSSLAGRFPGYLWNQIIKADLLKEAFNNIIPTNFGEDTFAIWHVYFRAKNLVFIDDVLYHYNIMNTNSLVHNINYNHKTWVEQKLNLEKIEKLYYSKKQKNEFHVVVNYLIYTRKYLFISAFDSPKHFYFTFRKSSFDILRFPDIHGRTNKIKTFLVNNVFLIFWFLYRKSFKTRL